MGHVLVARQDPELRDAPLLVVAHDFHGALAIRLNRPSNQLVRAALAEWADLAHEPAVVFDGGPVGRYMVIALAGVTRTSEPLSAFSPLVGRLGLQGLNGWGLVDRLRRVGVMLVDGGRMPEG
jgi:putative transcriptional regulator